MISKPKRGYQKLMPELEGSIMPQAKFLQDLYYLALARYQLASQYAQDQIILDAGCGAGYGAAKLAQAGAKKVYGVDISADSVQYCQEHYYEPSLSFQQGNLTSLDFPDGFFDLIVALEVIEHIKDYEKAISEFYRVLKPEGMLIISTPNKKIYSWGTKKPFYPFHFHEFNLAEFQEMLKDFQIKEIYGQYIKGKKMLLYSPWHPKRIIRIIFAYLPFVIKRQIMRWYLKIYAWFYQKRQNALHPP